MDDEPGTFSWRRHRSVEQGEAKGVKVPVSDEGFVSPEIENWRKKHRQDYPAAFAIARRVNAVAIKALHASQPSKTSKQHLMVAILFARSLEHFECAIALAELGAIPSAQCLLRVMCEATFSLALAAKEETFVDEYINDDRLRLLAMSDALLGLRPENTAVPADELQKIKAEARALRAEVNADRQKELVAFDTAKRAGLIDFYRLFYVPFSNSVHTSVRDLTTHVRETPEGDIASLKWGPHSAEVEDVVDAAVQIFLAAFHGFLSVFDHQESRLALDAIWAEQKPRLERKGAEWRTKFDARSFPK